MEINFNRIKIHFKTTGTGTPVVLLHGFLETGKIWAPFIEIIAEKHQVINIDLLGHGKTGCVGYIHTMETMAEAVHAIFSELKITSEATFIGHSMGGYVSLAFLEKYPYISQRVPQTQIASYLGMTPEFLSQVRRNIS